jgi:acyl-CoA hydrolase
MKHITYFTVFPDDCNYMQHLDGTPMVHGGTMLLKMDRAAAELARILIKGTECNSVLTVGVNDVTFYHGAKLGDMIRLEVYPTAFGVKRIELLVECYVDEVKMCDGKFVFCSFKDGKSHPHGIKL